MYLEAKHSLINKFKVGRSNQTSEYYNINEYWVTVHNYNSMANILSYNKYGCLFII